MVGSSDVSRLTDSEVHRPGHTGCVWYGPSHDKILFVLGLVRREFRRGSEVPTVGSSGIDQEF